MTVDLAYDGTEGILETFARRLTILPNLHILEVISMSAQYSRSLYKVLNGIKHPQTRTLFYFPWRAIYSATVLMSMASHVSLFNRTKSSLNPLQWATEA